MRKGGRVNGRVWEKDPAVRECLSGYAPQKPEEKSLREFADELIARGMDEESLALQFDIRERLRGMWRLAHPIQEGEWASDVLYAGRTLYEKIYDAGEDGRIYISEKFYDEMMRKKPAEKSQKEYADTLVRHALDFYLNQEEMEKKCDLLEREFWKYVPERNKRAEKNLERLREIFDPETAKEKNRLSRIMVEEEKNESGKSNQ